ncbi:Hsp70 protein-domain-containing protein [Baffinella frigidus]|nr:Hsp70 protein-domain-containing protein [Cryptophyta sp. CCMP2293]
MGRLVGIDLGTTRSCIAVWDGTQEPDNLPTSRLKDKAVHVIANESGDNTTPSWVCYPDVKQRRVGKAAERAGTKYASSVVYHSKRLIGCKYGEKVLQDAANLRWPFRVVDVEGGAGIQITVAGQPKTITPEEVGAGILSYLKKVAEEFIGRPVRRAVITVPAYFNDSQRQATRDAGHIAGLEVLQADVSAGAKNLLVFDFGGGTLDVTIMQIEPNSMNFQRVWGGTLDMTIMQIEPNSMNFQVRATDGDTRLGGEDLDARLVDHFLEDE